MKKSLLMNHKGITLVELVIVVVIIAIGAVLMVPSIGAWLPYYRLTSGTRDLVSTMRVAQMKAISNNLRYQISFISNNSYVLQYQNTGGGWVNDGATQTLPKGIQLNTTFGNSAAFFPDSSSTNGNVVLNNTKGKTKTIQLFGVTGRIKSG